MCVRRDLPSEYSREWRRVKQLVAAHDVRRLVSETIIDSDPAKCVSSSRGPLVFSDWRVDYPLWRFGFEPPISFTPVTFRAPNVVIMCPLAPMTDPAATAAAATVNVKASGGLEGGGGSGGHDGDQEGHGEYGNGSYNGSGGGLCLHVALHRVAWKRLDEMYGNDLAVAF
ncbi:hypothetical protein Vretimale_248 [Volvox reticuliferus]|uniref:Uncharacterized protein n=1 Tax=Volvox reticuliferus TaxID=1737510 RepID=A0A8J4D6R1_9CHLO|nr:hypothetical protein Vretifemale_8230 [Volvox reticuliferus]GIL93969.1 hypothetical protein Vretimale_248 [Volvox reticuliferus]